MSLIRKQIISFRRKKLTIAILAPTRNTIRRRGGNGLPAKTGKSGPGFRGSFRRSTLTVTGWARYCPSSMHHDHDHVWHDYATAARKCQRRRSRRRLDQVARSTPKMISASPASLRNQRLWRRCLRLNNPGTARPSAPPRSSSASGAVAAAAAAEAEAGIANRLLDRRN